MKNKFNKNWIHDHINDPYVKQAQKEGYRARAAYKLKEIDESEQLIQRGQIIVDLGSTPGSWSQYVKNRLTFGNGKTQGTIIGLDMLPMVDIPEVFFIQGDFREEAVLSQLDRVLGGRKVDVVLSDMAPNLSGIAIADAARMDDLVELALEFSQNHLAPSGSLLVKCFHGSGYQKIVEQFRATFKKVSIKKPKASRDKSSETYLLGRELSNVVKNR